MNVIDKGQRVFGAAVGAAAGVTKGLYKATRATFHPTKAVDTELFEAIVASPRKDNSYLSWPSLSKTGAYTGTGVVLGLACAAFTKAAAIPLFGVAGPMTPADAALPVALGTAGFAMRAAKNIFVHALEQGLNFAEIGANHGARMAIDIAIKEANF